MADDIRKIVREYVEQLMRHARLDRPAYRCSMWIEFHAPGGRITTICRRNGRGSERVTFEHCDYPDSRSNVEEHLVKTLSREPYSVDLVKRRTEQLRAFRALPPTPRSASDGDDD